MKRILFIIEHLDSNGAERSLIDLLNQIDYRKYYVDLLLIQKLGDSIDEIPKQVHVHLHSLNNAFGAFIPCTIKAICRMDFFSLVFRIIYMIAVRFGWRKLTLAKALFPDLRNEYDAVIAYRHSICTDFAAYLFNAKKRIGWWHHGMAPESSDHLARINQAYSEMTNVVAVSECSAEIVKKCFPNAREKLCIIPNMICVNELERKAALGFEITQKQKGKTCIVSVGRLDIEKNMTFCVEVGKELYRRGVEFKWFMIGDGQEKNRIEQMIKDYKLESCFSVTGRLTNPYPFIKQADIFFHPSLVESQGIAILESMALGTPVVAVDSLGPKEYIQNGTNGILISPNVSEAATKIIYLINNPSKRAEIAEEAAKTVLDYRPQKVICLFDQLMNQ